MEDGDATPTHYFLVEIWIERSVIDRTAPIARARLRDLATERAVYVKSAPEMIAFFEESLALAGVRSVRWQEWGTG